MLQRRVSNQPPLMLAPQSWKDAVRARLKELRWSQNELARRVGCSGAAISLLLSEATAHSKLVIPICDALELAYPESHGTPVELREWLRVGEEMSPSERHHFLELMKLYLGGKNR